MFDFEVQVKRQEEYYTCLMDWLKSQRDVQDLQQATEQEDRHKGIDLWIITAEGKRVSLQVKIDFWAHKTGNLIFEVISQAYSDRAVLGWAFTTRAECLVFLIASTGDVYLFRTSEYVRWAIDHYDGLPNFSAENKGYKTLGCKISLRDVSQICFGKGNVYDRNAMEIS